MASDPERFIVTGSMRRTRAGLLAGLILTVGFAEALNAEPARAAGWLFDAQDVGDTLGNDVDDVMAADFDGDGDLDFVLGDDPYLSWYENLGGSPPAFTRRTVASGDAYLGLTTGDFDGDGDTDIASGLSSSGYGIYWYENNGDGGGWDRHALPVTGTLVDNMRAHDYNGDGRDDLLIEAYGNAPVYYSHSPANPEGAWLSYQIGSGEGLSVGDADGDGDMDAVSGGKLYLCPANPAQANWPFLDLSPDGSFDKSGMADFNRDGAMDIALSEGEGSTVLILFGPTWTSSHTVFDDGDYGLHTLQIADFDRDGDPDLFTAEIHGAGRTFLFENADGAGTAWTLHLQSAGDPDGTHNGWIGDFNGDNRMDLIGKHYGGGQITIWYNTLLLEADFRLFLPMVGG